LFYDRRAPAAAWAALGAVLLTAQVAIGQALHEAVPGVTIAAAIFALALLVCAAIAARRIGRVFPPKGSSEAPEKRAHGAQVRV
jgi:hypothetical protein